MRTRAYRLMPWVATAGLVAALLFIAMPALDAGTPRGAYYSTDTDKVFWFVQASDTHIGASGSDDTNRLQWLVTTGRTVINPSFIVVTGDLTDSTNGNWLGIPNGPYQAEWDAYKTILSNAGMTSGFYYDIPGNHDAYNDRYFAYYLANSVQGRATGRTQLSWTRSFGFGTYHFLGVNSSGNTGAAFSIGFPYGDPAGLDVGELAFIEDELAKHSTANLTFVFGHHPVTDTGASGDTWLFYGQQQFIAGLDSAGASSYDYGHTHETSQTHFTGNGYTGTMANGGMQYLNVASLAKSSSSQYRVVAVDCDGVSSVTQTVGTWPVVLVTAPVAKYVGAALNPYAYTVSNGPANPIRALVFDAAAVSSVSFRIDGSAVWQPMARVAGSAALWNGAWNASALAAGEHTIEVRAVGSSTRSHTIKVDVSGAPPANQPPVAANDAYATDANTPLSVAAPGVLGNDSDPENTALSARLATGPAHGSLALNADGGFTYTPAAGYFGSDSFTYTASDGSLQSNAAAVSLTVSPPAADSVTVTAATYTKKTRKLSVTAKSTAQPNVTLTVVGYGQMTWNSKSKAYTYSVTTSTPPSSVTVTSSLGGSAMGTVTVK